MKRRIAAWLCALSLLTLCAAVPAQARESIILSAQRVALDVGETGKVEATVRPSENEQIFWSSGNRAVVTVLPDGTLLGVNAGTALVTARTVGGETRQLRVTVAAAVKPTRVVIEQDGGKLSLNDTLQLSARALPESASQRVVWRSSNAKVATVSSSGLVKPLKAGAVKIAARSRVKPAVYDVVRFTVYDPDQPDSIRIEQGDSTLSLGGALNLTVTASPSDADASVTWKSAKPDVATVSASGRVTAVGIGSATITATAKRGGAADSIAVTVLNEARVTEVPARNTAVSAAALKNNLARIKAVRLSAYAELNALSGKGEISASDAARRKNILVNAFSMYSFPWVTSARVPYWTSGYNGKKDFMPGRMYYGLPYIQTGTDEQYTNRRYNVTAALSGGYYAKTGNGYYRMTPKRMANRYVGNDCSAYVSLATWMSKYPLTNAINRLTTTDLMKSSYYNTISGRGNLRPGDLLVRGGSHTVMFLYFTDADQDRMMIIEQGGGNSADLHNTVCCSVVNVSSYSGYTLRRAKDLSKT